MYFDGSYYIIGCTKPINKQCNMSFPSEGVTNYSLPTVLLYNYYTKTERWGSDGGQDCV
jgi:hypothetical protein